MDRRRFLLTIAGGGAMAAAGCVGSSDDGLPPVTGETLRLTTTTSTYDTGVVEALNDGFEDRFGIAVEAIAQGTGQALRTARNGDADVVMVHARSLEDAFIADGYGINRRNLMFNDFVVVGPDADPARIDGFDEPTAAFEAIATAAAVFVSRGDNSGTHTAELEIWEAAGITPDGAWYREAGSGMGEVLTQANLEPGYALTDRATYLAMRDTLDRLDIRVEGPVEGGPALLANPYGIIAVNPGAHDHVAYDLAMAYIGFVTSTAGQAIIEGYTVDGEPLFFPRAIAADPNFHQYVPRDWRPAEADG